MTLTQAATITRKGILISIILVVLSVLGLIGYRVWYNYYYLPNLPKVEEKPEMKFGPLPRLNFPSSNISPSNFYYSLDTVTGGLPKTPKLLRVYFIPKGQISLMTTKKLQDLASNLGFPNGPQVQNPTEYSFKDEDSNELFINLQTGNFYYQRLNTSTESSQLKTPFTGQNQLIETLKNYLSSRNLLPEELQSGSGHVLFDQSSPELSDNAVVSLLPDKLDNLPILTSFIKDGLVKATVTQFNDEKKKFVSLNYIFWPVDKTTFSTYPLKSAAEAFGDLKTGNGFISLEPGKPQISISSVYLAYFQSEEYSPYLQPVFVFEGPGFAALVPAIKE